VSPIIVKNAVKDMPLREKIFAARQRARDLLFGQSVDRAAIEKLRSEQIGTVDALSKRFTQALVGCMDCRRLVCFLYPTGKVPNAFDQPAYNVSPR
jgi:hypothetical protein